MANVHWVTRTGYMFNTVDRLTDSADAETLESVIGNYRNLLQVAMGRLDPEDREDLIGRLDDIVRRYQPHL
jgi:hypothetical protein